MSITGPAPKQGAQRRNKDTFDKTFVEWDGEVRGPELPDGFDWHERTVAWYEKWRRSPQALVMTETDWELMLETALLHSRFWGAPARMSPAQITALAGEIKRRVSAYGATFEDRLKLRIVISTPLSEQDDERDIKNAAYKAINYAERLLNASATVISEAPEEE